MFKCGYLLVYLDQEIDEALTAGGQIFPTRQSAIDYLQKHANILGTMQTAEIYEIGLDEKALAKVTPKATTQSRRGSH
jgi:hypothetical protein